MAFARVHGTQLYYERRGKGRPLLFVGGTGGDLREKPNVLQGPWVDTFEVLAYDQRNLGRSDKIDAAATMADYADDAAGFSSAAAFTTDWRGPRPRRLFRNEFRAPGSKCSRAAITSWSRTLGRYRRSRRLSRNRDASLHCHVDFAIGGFG